MQTLSPNLSLFQRLQLVYGQDLRSFVRNTCVRLWNTLACASGGDKDPLCPDGHLPRNGENPAACRNSVCCGNLDFSLLASPKMLTLGIVQTSLTLHSLNRIFHSSLFTFLAAKLRHKKCGFKFVATSLHFLRLVAFFAHSVRCLPYALVSLRESYAFLYGSLTSVFVEVSL